MFAPQIARETQHAIMGEIEIFPFAVEDQRSDQFGVQRPPGTQADIEPSSRQDIHHRKVLGQTIRALIADRDDRGSKLDTACPLCCRRQERAGR
jgi:hypothetical protein